MYIPVLASVLASLFSALSLAGLEVSSAPDFVSETESDEELELDDDLSETLPDLSVIKRCRL